MAEVKIKMEHDDSLKLQRLHFSVESRVHLFERLVTGTEKNELNSFYEKFITDFEKIYKEYIEFKAEIEFKYKPVEFTSSAKSWSADFDNETIVFEVIDA